MTTLTHQQNFPKQLSPLRHARMELLVDLLYLMEVVHEDPDSNAVQWNYLDANTFKSFHHIYGLTRQPAEQAIDDAVNYGLAVIKNAMFLELTPQGHELGEQLYRRQEEPFTSEVDEDSYE